MNKLIMWLEKHLVVIFVNILGRSLRFKLNRPRPEERVIYSFWHRNMIPLLYLHRKQKTVLLISSSKDGELIAAPAELMGYKTARGSSRRGGSAASRELIRLAKEYFLAITPDGPKGPNQQVKEGIILLSYLTKLPIVPLIVDVRWEKVFKTWDKFRLPFLFSKVNVNYGEPILVKSKTEITEKLEELQNAMDRLTIENKIEP